MSLNVFDLPSTSVEQLVAKSCALFVIFLTNAFRFCLAGSIALITCLVMVLISSARLRLSGEFKPLSTDSILFVVLSIVLATWSCFAANSWRSKSRWRIIVFNCMFSSLVCLNKVIKHVVHGLPLNPVYMCRSYTSLVPPSMTTPQLKCWRIGDADILIRVVVGTPALAQHGHLLSSRDCLIHFSHTVHGVVGLVQKYTPSSHNPHTAHTFCSCVRVGIVIMNEYSVH